MNTFVKNLSIVIVTVISSAIVGCSAEAGGEDESATAEKVSETAEAITIGPSKRCEKNPSTNQLTGFCIGGSSTTNQCSSKAYSSSCPVGLVDTSSYNYSCPGVSPVGYIFATNRVCQ